MLLFIRYLYRLINSFFILITVDPRLRKCRESGVNKNADTNELRAWITFILRTRIFYLSYTFDETSPNNISNVLITIFLLFVLSILNFWALYPMSVVRKKFRIAWNGFELWCNFEIKNRIIKHTIKNIPSWLLQLNNKK